MFEAKLLLLVLLLYVFGNAPWVVRNKRIVGAKKVKWSVCFIIALPKEQSETGEHFLHQRNILHALATYAPAMTGHYLIMFY